MSYSGDLSKLLPPLCDRDHIRGSLDATIVLMEYADFPCSQSQQAYFTIKRLQQQLGNQLCLVFRCFPQPWLYPQAQKVAETAEAAASQGKFWEMHDLLFENQDALEDGCLVEYAVQLELDIPQFLKELSNHVHAHHIQACCDMGQGNGVQETPTFFIGIRHCGTANLDVIVMSILQTYQSYQRNDHSS